MTLADVIAVAALVIGAAIAIYFGLHPRAPKPTEPWNLSKLGNGLWELERLGKQKVWITYLWNHHGGMVIPTNPAAAPVYPFEAGKKLLLRFDPMVPGTVLTVFYRPVTKEELKAKLNIAPEYNTPEAIREPSWSGHLY